ncbi:MAG: ABC transporter permease [Planctomycetales bacterium]|nr:ABC transporter permease [Planctomycetales bacterium]
MASIEATIPDVQDDQIKSRAEEDAGDWTLLIEPRNSLFDLRLHEVWHYRDLLFLFVRRDFVAFYKQTILGPVWFFVQPILTTLMFILVFKNIAGLSTDGLPPILFYLCGVTFWNYFADCFNKTATVFTTNAQLFGKVYFPRVIAPLAIVMSNLVRFGVQFVLFMCFLAWFWARGEVQPNAAALLMPLLIAIMATFSLGLGMLFSALTTKYRDLVFLLSFGVQLLMYATPVIYPMSQMSPRIAQYLRWNPLAPLIETARYGFLGSGSFSWGWLAYSATIAVMAFLASTVVFNRVEKTFMDTV